ncbi:MAG TPA: BTAD domain-containing putative transcriptional regulator [Gemmatimonadaceae bacterium]|jgi:serine/threonine-protein kinase|nr:BTAD domain-containing putative transcriptional regulator [Gemmatimonadaceae bacterium]
MATLTLELLGGVELHGLEPAASERILVQPKLLALLAYLSLAGASRRYQRRDHLVALLWPELDQAHARTALRKAVHFIRGALGNETILSRGDEELGVAEGAMRCDALEFVAQIDAGRLAAAMDLYKGDLMPGFHLSGCADFERWLDDERNALRERAGGAALALAQMFEMDSSYTIATKWARRAARFSWDDERVLRRALSLMDRAGDRSGALRLYDEFAERLKADFDADPSPETTALVRQIRPA